VATTILSGLVAATIINRAYPHFQEGWTDHQRMLDSGFKERFSNERASTLMAGIVGVAMGCVIVAMLERAGTNYIKRQWHPLEDH
jgi:hypothetical protein